mmetsp:Transcript_39073/g.97438  ORF Transcript_39073/g.97438 Transcript_39073/m.97438 type:complete len:147 (-) Transcript_39073:502-942(-)
MLNHCGAACVEAGDATGADCALPRGSAVAHKAWAEDKGDSVPQAQRRWWCTLPVAGICLLEILQSCFPQRLLVLHSGVSARHSAPLPLLVCMLAAAGASLRAPLRDMCTSAAGRAPRHVCSLQHAVSAACASVELLARALWHDVAQ